MTGLAVFDLDRTLTRKGGFLPFVAFALRRRPARLVAAPHLLVRGAGLALKLQDRDGLKQRIWTATLAGMKRDDAARLGAEFAKTWADRALRQGAKAAIQRHKAAGDRLMLATAAMDLVAEPFGRALGFDDIVATRSAWTADGRIAAGFEGANCYGLEKLRRVEAALPDDAFPSRTVAYSDHVTDLPLLNWAARGVAVNPHKPLADVAEANGLEVADWDSPPPEIAPDTGPR